jgi:uncharacterized membrane protein
MNSEKFDKIYPVLSIIIFLFFVIHYSILPYLEYINFNTRTFDLSIYFQYILGLSEGEYYNSARDLNFFGHHIQIILYPIVWLYKIIPHLEIVFFIQSISVGIAGLFLYKLAEKKLNSKYYGLLILLIFYLTPAVGYSLLFEFHPIVISVLFISGFFYYDYINKNKLSFVFLILAVLCQENVALIFLGIGMYKILDKQFCNGIYISLFSLIYFFIIIKIIKSQFSGLEYDTHLKYFYHLGKNYSEIFNTIIFSPIKTLKIMFHPYKHKLFYLLLMLGPYLFIPLFRIKYIVMYFPILFIYLVSNNPLTTMLYSHYNIIIIPLFMFSIIDFLNQKKCNIKKTVLYISLILMFITHLFNKKESGVSILSPCFNYEQYQPNYAKPIYLKTLELLNKNDTISCDSNLAAHIHSFGKIKIFPELFAGKTDYVLINFNKSETVMVDEISGKVFHKKNNLFYDIYNILVNKYNYKPILEYKPDNKNKIVLLKNMD